MSRKLGPIQQGIIEALDGAALRGVEVAARLAPSSPSAVRRALVALGRRGAIVQDRDCRRWSLPLPPSTPGTEAAMRRLVRGMRRAAENVEITKLKQTIRLLRIENRRLTRLLRESEINPYSLERIGLPPRAVIKRGL
jgi:DNA-binding IclR family transcriptional regulator